MCTNQPTNHAVTPVSPLQISFFLDIKTQIKARGANKISKLQKTVLTYPDFTFHLNPKGHFICFL